MKKNIFDQTGDNQSFELSHSDQASIIGLAKNKSVGTLQNAISMYAENNKELAHGIDDIDTLFPDYKDVYPGAPEVLLRDQGWVDVVMSKAHKSPISRIRTRQTDARDVTVRGSGYQKTKKKAVAPNVKLLKRTTDPQTVYRKDALNRDDIVDITDFDVVEYQYGIMRSNLNEEIATAIMIGDGREDGDEAKIKAAKTFIEFIAADPAQVKDSVLASTYFPVRTSVGDIYAGNEVMSEYSKFMGYLGDYYQITPGWTTARTEWWNMLQRVGSGEAVETAVKTFVDNANAAAAAEA